MAVAMVSAAANHRSRQTFKLEQKDTPAVTWIGSPQVPENCSKKLPTTDDKSDLNYYHPTLKILKTLKTTKWTPSELKIFRQNFVNSIFPDHTPEVPWASNPVSQLENAHPADAENHIKQAFCLILKYF